MITILRTYLLIMDLLIVRGYEFKSLFQLIYIYIYIYFLSGYFLGRDIL